MNSYLIELEYIKKSILFVFLLGFISLGSIGGCSDNGSGNTQALTENDFADDSMLRADPEKGNVVDFLESPNSESTENDTGVVGVDEIPLRYERTVEHTFCWEDENIDAMHFMLLLDSQGEEVLRVDVNGDCVTDTIEPGDYVRVYDLITPTLSELDKRAAVHVGIIENEIHLGNYCAFSHMLFLSKVKLNYVLL